MTTRQLKHYVENPKIRSMRVRSWFHAVSQASGLTVGELEREFREEGSARTPRSCIWNKYKRGEVVPRSRYQGDGRPKLVERVEARYPGTEKWLFSPLWLLADVAPMEMSDLRRIYEGLPPRIREYFILPPSLVTKVFWRCPLHSEQLLMELLRFHTVEDLVAAVALIREAEIIQSRPLFQYWILAIQNLMRQVDWGGLRNSMIPRELREYLQRRWAIG
ncbi:hypothetical protein [Dechloromonas denitrificans]|uniref:hypothetical protein n=1 Tax=Dechloromonas denitrificans TaxID=281362 RepID=UPI001CF8CF78|nr:hypothetical protein [Dechloromonas denitrificans]UCV02705.1 hypothetical protein KI611_16695 [Dechloromonas denitrificans]